MAAPAAESRQPPADGVEVYRPRRPRASPLYRLLERHFRELSLVWDERFAPTSGDWRAVIPKVADQFLACGLLEHGFARIRCDACAHEYLLAFSCKCRYFCPSCHSKRLARWSLWLDATLLAPVPHRQVVLTLPKRLRADCLYRSCSAITAGMPAGPGVGTHPTGHGTRRRASAGQPLRPRPVPRTRSPGPLARGPFGCRGVSEAVTLGLRQPGRPVRGPLPVPSGASSRAGEPRLTPAEPTGTFGGDNGNSYSFRGEHQLRAVVEFGAGRLLLRSGPADRLYGITLKYDAERFEPIGSYNPTTAEVRLGVASHGGGGIRVNRERALPQVAVVEFPASVDLTLDVAIGAADGTLDLGGLRISSLDLKSGASHTAISFDSPNQGSCRTAQITSGAGELTIAKAGNSGCRTWHVDGGVGAVSVDLDGAWPADARMSLNMALGGVTLHPPKDLGLRVTVSGFLSGFDAKGFTKSGKTYSSSNYASAKRHLEIEVSSALGGVDVVWK